MWIFCFQKSFSLDHLLSSKCPGQGVALKWSRILAWTSRTCCSSLNTYLAVLATAWGLEKKILLCNRDLRWRKVDCYCREEVLFVEGNKNNNYFVSCNLNKVYWNVPTLRWSAGNDSRASFAFSVKKMTFRIVSRIHNLGCVLTTQVSCMRAMMLKKWMLCSRDRFTVQRMLVNQNAIFLPGHAVSSMKATWSCHNLSKNQSAHSPGSDLINLGANTCKLISLGIKPSGQQ